MTPTREQLKEMGMEIEGYLVERRLKGSNDKWCNWLKQIYQTPKEIVASMKIVRGDSEYRIVPLYRKVIIANGLKV